MVGCRGRQCCRNSLYLTALSGLIGATVACDLYLAPSLIKEEAEHGFGLGVFTGRSIKAGDVLENEAEALIPLYDSKTIDDPTNHSPLREYVWNSLSTLPELGIVGSTNRSAAFWYSGGLAAVAPCTSWNFNLQLSGSGWLPGVSRRNLVEDSMVPPRTSPQAGAYAYRHGLSYVATQNIEPGDELVVACTDDDFNPLEMKVQSNPFVPNDERYMCLDNVRSDESELDEAGKGLFATKSLSKGDTILSSPVVPIHRKELSGDGTGGTAPSGINAYQLLINYALGHEDSDLLILPYGPFVNYLNNRPRGESANAMLRWKSTEVQEGQTASRRLQYHHPELLKMSAIEVANTHGKGLVLEVVASDDIAENDEIYLDYGRAWSKAWDDHVDRWRPPNGAETYMSADQWFHRQRVENIVATEEELKDDPLPANLQTVCYFDADAKFISAEEGVTYSRWQDDELPHECLRPCKILERYSNPDPEDEDDMWLYKAEMFHFDGEEKFNFCSLPPGRHVTKDLTYDGIFILDKPYTHDLFLTTAFRHEIGIRDIFPTSWMRKKLRKKEDESAIRARSEEGAEFRRKKPGEVKTKKLLMKEQKEKSARMDL